MIQGDFVRQMPSESAELAQRSSIWRRLHIDPWLLLLILLLTGFGLVVLYSASGQSLGMVLRQGRFFLVAYVAMVLIAQLDPERIKRLAPLAYLLGVLLLLAVPFFGVSAKGAQRWVSLGGFRFQPSEIMKLVVPMAVAWYFANRALPPRFKYIVVCLLMIAVPVVLIARQPDLGTAILIGCSGLFVLFLAGIGWRYIFGALALALLSAYPVWHFLLLDYQRQRILTLLNPESDSLGAGWNIIQSKTAIGSGGVRRQGLDQRHPVATGFSPGKPYRLYYRGTGRGVGLARCAGVAGGVCGDHRPRSVDLRARPAQFRPPAGGQSHADVFCVCVRQHGHGVRSVTGGGSAAAAGQSGRHLPGDPAGRVWFVDGYQHGKTHYGSVSELR